jgi:putative flippase GtrA
LRKLSLLSVEFSRIARFGLVGVLAALVYMMATTIAVEFLGFAAVGASIFGQLASASVSYVGHSFYSFGVESNHRAYLWRFIAVAVITFSLNGLVTHLLTDLLDVSYRVSIIVVVILIPITNYACNRFWVFRSGLHPSASSTADSSHKACRP